MAFTLRFDYRFDSLGFFDDPGRRLALEAAADQWEAIIQDEFADIPAGAQLDIRNPTTGFVETVTLDQPIDDILVFVGARDFGSSTLAIAGPDGGALTGDIYATRISPDFRGLGPVTDFEPWAGTIAFNTNARWSFDLDGPESGHSDFLSVAIHEIGHILGIGTSSAFDRWIIDHQFTGPNATRVNDGQPIPIEDDHSHVEDGFAGDSVALDPILTNGSRVLLSDYDKALLADIGYDIDGFDRQGSTPSLATVDAERVFGTASDDVIDGLGGNDSLQGAEGNDHLSGNTGRVELFGQEGDDTLLGGSGDDYLDGGAGDDELRGGPGADVYFGHGGRDTFVIMAGDGRNRLSDFDPGLDRIRLVDSGFASTNEALAAISKPFGNVSRITFEDGTTVDIFHRSQSGTPLTADHLELTETEALSTRADGAPDGTARAILSDQETSAPVQTLLGTPFDDILSITPGLDLIDGLDGVDTVLLPGNAAPYIVEVRAGELHLTDRSAEGLDAIILDNVELIRFEQPDTTFGGQMDLRLYAGHGDLDAASLDSLIEMYIAYFDRAPDAVGLGYWATAFANGLTMEEIADFFFDQDETRALYPEDQSTFHFISGTYQNVLGRAPDLDGLLFWEAVLDSGAVSRGGFILELLAGVKADLPPSTDSRLVDRQSEDQRYLDLKTELGAHFALDHGMTDPLAAAQVMGVFDGTDRSFDAATDLIDTLYAAASDPMTGSFLMPLIGVFPASDIL